MKKHVCATAVCAAFSLNAFAQSALDQARTAAGMAAIDRAQSTGFLAGLERALKTPLEIVWLRAAADESLWNDPALSRTSAVGRTAWRYVFGGNAQFAPRPNEVARLVVSTLTLPQGALNAGRLDLTGTGRLYLVTPEAPSAKPPERLAMILAAGSTLHISDATAPAIHIELKAPEDRPMLLGNLAAADIGKVLSLLVKPGSANAFEASVADDGRVALRGSGGELQLAALLPGTARTDVATQLAKQPVERRDDGFVAFLSPAFSPVAPDARQAGARSAPQLARDFASLGAALEAPVRGSGFESVIVASLATAAELAPRARPAGAPAGGAPTEARFEMQQVAAVMESALRREMDLVASLSPRDVPALIVTRGAQDQSKAKPIERPAELAQLDFSATASGNEPVLIASLAPAVGTAPSGLKTNVPSARTAAAPDFAAELGAVARTAESAVKVAPTQIAALPVAPGALEFKAAAATQSAAVAARPTTAAELARMREEVEAEIARERERLAAQFKPQIIGAPAPKRFVLGV
jgi:hypothetical protein